MTDEKSSLATHQIITIKKPEQNANGAADGGGIGGNGSIFIATDDNDEDTVPLGLTTKAVCMQVSTRCGSLLNNPPPFSPLYQSVKNVWIVVSHPSYVICVNDMDRAHKHIYIDLRMAEMLLLENSS